MISPPPMHPEISLSDIFDTRILYNPRSSFTPYGWLSTDPVARAAYSGGALTVAGRMTTICADSVIGPAARRLYQLAGIDSLPPVIAFSDQHDYQSILQRLAREDRQLVFQHVHPPGEVPETLYAVPRHVLADLNDKAQLHKFVPPEFVPQRAIIALEELQEFAGTAHLPPLVLKGGGPMSSGAGASVAIVRGPTDWTEACRRLEIARQIVVEELLDIRDNFCLNFFTQGTSSVFLGASRQIIDDSGQYLGNWFDPQDRPPATAVAVGHVIMQTAIQLGYRGVAGFDMVVDRHGRILVIDLNFRLNGSTPILMWGRTLWQRSRQSSIAKSFSTTFPAADSAMLETLAALVSSHSLFPLALVDGRDPLTGFGNIELRGLALGESRGAVQQIEDFLKTACDRLHEPSALRPPAFAPELSAVRAA